MVHFKLNGKDVCVEEHTTIAQMLELFGLVLNESDQADQMLMITEHNVPIRGRTNELFVEEGNDISAFAMPYGG